jgi:hypothetical protein
MLANISQFHTLRMQRDRVALINDTILIRRYRSCSEMYIATVRRRSVVIFILAEILMSNKKEANGCL